MAGCETAWTGSFEKYCRNLCDVFVLPAGFPIEAVTKRTVAQGEEQPGRTAVSDSIRTFYPVRKPTMFVLLRMHKCRA
jgi:hypothetical protein